MDSPYSWHDEAQAVIKDVEALVKSIKVSEKLKSDEHKIYLNIMTNENRPYCIELSPSGFRIVGEEHDATSINEGECFDTPYSLLSKISKSYDSTFAHALISKLKDIEDRQ